MEIGYCVQAKRMCFFQNHLEEAGVDCTLSRLISFLLSAWVYAVKQLLVLFKFQRVRSTGVVVHPQAPNLLHATLVEDMVYLEARVTTKVTRSLVFGDF